MLRSKLTSMFKISALAMAVIVPQTLWAGTAEVVWHQPEKYSDIQAGEDIQTHFQEKIFKDLGGYINDLAGHLPEGYVLHMTVTDLNLAGEVEPQTYQGGMRLLRVIRSADFPSIAFSYQLNNAKGEQLMAGEERVRGRVLPGQGRLHTRSMTSNDQLEYEQAMLSRWFKEKFSDEIALAQNNN